MSTDGLRETDPSPDMDRREYAGLPERQAGRLRAAWRAIASPRAATPRGYPYPLRSWPPDAAIDIQLLAEALETDITANVLVAPGAIMLWNSAAPPVGWGICNGAAVLRDENPVLFAMYGTSQGAGLLDGVTFSLPDMRNLTAVGAGGSYALGSTGGAATHALNLSEMPQHQHTIRSLMNDTAAPNNRTDGVAAAPGNASAETSEPVTSVVGSSAAHNNMPPYRALHYIIKLG